MPRALLVRFALVCGGLLVALGCEEGVRPPQPTASPGTAAPTATATPPTDWGLIPELAAGEAWPVFRGTVQSTGVTAARLPDELQVVWKNNYEDGMFEATPAIVGGAVYLGGLHGYFYALDLSTGAEKWKPLYSELGFNAPAAARDGRVYTGDTEGRFYCLDAATGAPLWGHQTGAEINGGATFWRDKVLFGSQDATLYCLDAATGALAWKFTTDDMIQCSPTVVEDRAFVAGCDSKLHIVDLTTGQAAGSVNITSPTGCTPAVLGDWAWFGTQGETFLCVDWRQQKVLWTWRNLRRSFPFHGSAAVTPEIVVFGGRDKQIHGLDPRTGKEVWPAFAARGRIDGSPVIVGGRAYVGSADGRLYGLDLKSGEKVWEYDAGAGFSGSPAVVDGHLVIGTDGGDVLCFGAKK